MLKLKPLLECYTLCFSQLGPTFQYAMFFRRWIQVSEEHFDMPCSPEGDFRRWKYEHRHGQEGLSETGRSRHFLFSEMFSRGCVPTVREHSETYEHPHGQEGVSETGRSRPFWVSEMFSRGCISTVGEHSKTYEHPHGQEGVSETGLTQSYSDEKHLPK